MSDDMAAAIVQLAREIRSHEKRIVELQAALTAERQAREQAEQERDRLKADLLAISAAYETFRVQSSTRKASQLWNEFDRKVRALAAALSP
jgi:chromosome segregation ATPase